MPTTFGEAWKAVRLHAPAADPFLCRYWVQQVYSRLCDRRSWSWLRAEGEFLTEDAKSGTVNVTRQSAHVTGVGLTFAASDVDRQFRVGTAPVYTIQEFISSTEVVLDRVYGGATASATTGQVIDAYVTCPEDFGQFIAVIDPNRSWRLRLHITEHEINRWDARRAFSGTPFALISRRLGTTDATAGGAQYELWPYTTTAQNYPFYYFVRPAILQDADEFLGVLAKRVDVLVTGALVEAALWPGTVTEKNPYFNPLLAREHAARFELEVSQLEVRDEEVYLTWLETSGIDQLPWAPIDTNYWQSHAV